MDREKAADLLDNLIGMVEDNHGADYDTALKMGIEALSTSGDGPEPVDDTISRQAAIDAAIEAINEWGGGWDAEREARDAINALPSAQPEPQWIPCSERLPEDNVPVNITWINRKPEFYYAEIEDVPFTATGVYFKGRWYWYSSTVEDYLAEYGVAEWDEIEEAIEVVAWMPLPEPWRGEE